MMNFAAIDFETATSARNSACSVAVVEVKDGQLFDSYYTLIQPPGNRYNYFNTQIHGITREDTTTAPDFAAIWPELESHLRDRIVVAHNARFDMGVLRACLQDAQLPLPHFAYADTVTISRRAWPDLVNHKLDTVGAFLHIDFQHHNALDDARTCAAIPVYAGRELAVDDFRRLAERLSFRIIPFGSRKGGIPR
ncbi:MAG: 3'-5' exonuclease [Selenomonas sp.]|nr:3'-5' exonuclease [Selenomonas sp.]MDD6119223.1 3'-5' exonuclease [Selenomonadaceae bacterium]MDD7055477.1 3'-5' exonuclease [Selenomonadaceae bacterium]MDY3915791.1 3'-5' exonuclease [Selenomonadaceae bacterium]